MKMAPAPAPTAASALASHHQHHHHHHHHHQLHHRHQQFQVTEDTPVDYLEGCMEVLVVFPNEKSIPMSIQRRMPMLDLLIHVTAANKLSPAAHLLQVTDEDGRVLPQKPSTPIGSLNAHKVYIVPKNRSTGKADRFGGPRPSYQAKTSTHFEPTFRIQVRLPRNQLFVTRVTARTQLADVLHTVCNEKDLEPSHYEFRHPANQDERLKLSATLGDCKITEVVLVHVPLADSRPGDQPAGPSPSPASPGPSRQTVTDPAAAMSHKKGQPAYASGSTARLSGQSAKSALRSTTSEAALNHSGEKKRRGLLGLFGFGKHKKGSSMGDSSASSDSVGDRSISPTRSEEPAAEPPAPQQPRPPSPVLVSKRLAEEAMAKRNSRLLMNQKSMEAAEAAAAAAAAAAAVAVGTSEEPQKPDANGSTKAAARSGGKKRMAPPPPAASSVPLASPAPDPPANGLTKAESEVSAYTTCSSGSCSVSPPISVIDNSSLREATPSPIPSQNRPGSTTSYKTLASHEASPDRGHSSSNLLSTPHVSSTNLTAVSSTSNASLSSVVKKRKAPVPPTPTPALEEHQAEMGDEVPAASESNGHAESDSTSGSASDECASDVSAGSPKSRSVPRVVRTVSSGSLRRASPAGSDAGAGSRVEPPKPAPRTRKSYAQESTPSSDSERRSSLACAVSTNQDNNNNNARERDSSIDDDDLNLDDESLSMFAEKTEPKEIDPHELVTRQQLELAARQKAELEYEKKVLEQKARLKEAEKQKIQSLLESERQELEKIEHSSSAMLGEQAKPRKKWTIESPEIKLERWSSSSEDDEPTCKVGVDSGLLTAREHRSRANSMDTEFYSLSEGEDKQVSELSKQSTTLWQPRLSDGSGRSDPDADFAAMCESLARRKQRKQTANSALPSDLSQVPVELLQSLPPPAEATYDHDDLSPKSRKRVWRRSNSDPGWTIDEELSTSPPASRSVDNLKEFKHKSPSDPASSTLLSLNDTSLPSTSSYRGDHNGFVMESPAPLSWQPEVEGVRSGSPSEASKRPAEVHSDDDYEVLRPHNQNVYQSDDERKGGVAENRLTKADSIEEHVQSEALYSMIIKSTHGVRVVNRHQVDEMCDSQKENGGEKVVEPAASGNAATAEKVVTDEIKGDDEPEVERSPKERADSPVMWEFKLPAPPTPFADNGEGSPVVDNISIKSDSESDRSRHSSISTDSLQVPELGTVEFDIKEPIPSAVHQDLPTLAHDKLTLEHGNELAGESRTEDLPVQEQNQQQQEPQVAGTERTPSPPLLKQDKVILDETVTDESLSSFVPPLPLTLPPEIPGGTKEEEILIADPIEPPQIYQEEKVYGKRERTDSHSSNSSSTSSHSDAAASSTSQSCETCPGEANEAKSPPPEPTVKEPDVIVNQPTAPKSGSVGVNSASAFLPLMNVDFMQQFQAALTTISDPQARALQEEFLRLQQQFLTWQLQAAAQQQSTLIQPQQSTLAQAMATTPAVSQTSYPIAESPAIAEDKQEAPPVVQTPVVQDEPAVERSEAAVVQSEPSEESAQMESPAEKEKSSDESSEEAEEPVYRYAGPPQVKLDTWKPGRPRSEVIDYSNTLSFNIPSYSAGDEPKSKLVESKISTFEMSTVSRISSRPASASPTPTAAPLSSSASVMSAASVSTTVTAQKTSVVNKETTDSGRKEVKSPSLEETDSSSHSPVKLTEAVKPKKEELPKAEPKKDEKLDANKKEDETKAENNEAELSSGVKDKVGKFESNIDKSVVLRKSSFVTPRPFEPRPVSMPIKRPAIVPSVIQPGPFVSRKIQRAPEVRGFASLPSPELADPVKSIGSGEPGPTPFGSKPRPTSVASKENPTIVIRSKLLESARRPSAELDHPPIIQSEANEESKASRSTPETVEDKRPTPAARPLTMPASSSLILAANAQSSPKKEPIAPVSAPPPPAMLPATPAKRPMPSRFERKIDPREELLNSIRNFGVNGGTLRRTSTRID